MPKPESDADPDSISSCRYPHRNRQRYRSSVSVSTVMCWRPTGTRSILYFQMHIDSYSFGRIRIDGVDYGKDVIILRDTVHSPWWRDAGGHVFATGDLDLLIAAAPEVVCLGTGYFGRVTVPRATIEAFSAAGSRVVVEKTAAAVKEYNRLLQTGHDAAAALHLTC